MTRSADLIGIGSDPRSRQVNTRRSGHRSSFFVVVDRLKSLRFLFKSLYKFTLAEKPHCMANSTRPGVRILIDIKQMRGIDGRINLGTAQTRMPEQFLQAPQIGSTG